MTVAEAVALRIEELCNEKEINFFRLADIGVILKHKKPLREFLRAV